MNEKEKAVLELNRRRENKRYERCSIRTRKTNFKRKTLSQEI